MRLPLHLQQRLHLQHRPASALFNGFTKAFTGGGNMTNVLRPSWKTLIGAAIANWNCLSPALFTSSTLKICGNIDAMIRPRDEESNGICRAFLRRESPVSGF